MFYLIIMFIIYDHVLVGLCFCKASKHISLLSNAVECSIDIVYDSVQHCTIVLIERQIRRNRLRKQTKKVA